MTLSGLTHRINSGGRDVGTADLVGSVSLSVYLFVIVLTDMRDPPFMQV